MSDAELLDRAIRSTLQAIAGLEMVSCGHFDQIIAARDNLRAALAAAESLERRAQGVKPPKEGE